jgi:hypothetical protein
MKVYKSGTIIIANYVTFKGETKQGVFMVMYDEALDNVTDSVMNVTAIKITTQLSMVGNYTVNLKNEDSDFFKHESLASCSKIHTLHKNQIVGVIGILGEKTYKKVYTGVRKFINEIDRQMLGGLM